MSQTISVTFVAAGTFSWVDTDNQSTVASGTSTSVQAAGVAALAAMKTYLQGQATSFTVLNTSWQ